MIRSCLESGPEGRPLQGEGAVHVWGSLSYKEENDALRVAVKPQAVPHKERFEISFDELKDDSAHLVTSISCEGGRRYCRRSDSTITW